MKKRIIRVMAIVAISAAALGGWKSYTTTFVVNDSSSLFIDGVAAKAESDETSKPKETNPKTNYMTTNETITEKSIVYYKVTLEGKIIAVSSEADWTYTEETTTVTTKPVKYSSIDCVGGNDIPCTPTQWQPLP